MMLTKQRRISLHYMIAFLMVLACQFDRCTSFISPHRVVATPTKAFSSKRGGNDPGSFSYVEEGQFEDREDEIIALGGDPFFLTDDELKLREDGDAEGEKKWEWDGEVIEDAHMDFTDDKLKLREDGDAKGEKKWEWDGEVIEDAHMDFTDDDRLKQREGGDAEGEKKMGMGRRSD
eukprot:CAMPEP_0198136930 /NCGR_PEP_ID=MMETSP1443-20131203/479_1 /TAXON_ID=186043 /ORGANISM="Entomoneis sp., Strain CCMP2396" /LENGTH=175 /DNA_ID=CAMNT_0043798229 /DNA_START=114 /DNA_END=641 /DNA_ORIENTATION=+